MMMLALLQLIPKIEPLIVRATTTLIFGFGENGSSHGRRVFDTAANDSEAISEVSVQVLEHDDKLPVDNCVVTFAIVTAE